MAGGSRLCIPRPLGNYDLSSAVFIVGAWMCNRPKRLGVVRYKFVTSHLVQQLWWECTSICNANEESCKIPLNKLLEM